MPWWLAKCISRTIKALGNMIDEWLLVLIASFVLAVGGLSVLLIRGPRAQTCPARDHQDPAI
jgi:hypothetical protein